MNDEKTCLDSMLDERFSQSELRKHRCLEDNGLSARVIPLWEQIEEIIREA